MWVFLILEELLTNKLNFEGVMDVNNIVVEIDVIQQGKMILDPKQWINMICWYIDRI